MDAERYQHLAARTLIDEPDSHFTSNEIAVMLEALELTARVGKVMEYLKKGICHRHGFEISRLAELLRDVQDHIEDVYIAYHVPLSATVEPERQMLIWNALGLCGEAGEIAEIIKGVQWNDFDSTPLIKELGDSQWYAAALCTKIGASLSDVMEANIAKLRQRYPSGYSSDDSKARVDV